MLRSASLQQTRCFSSRCRAGWKQVGGVHVVACVVHGLPGKGRAVSLHEDTSLAASLAGSRWVGWASIGGSAKLSNVQSMSRMARALSLHGGRFAAMKGSLLQCSCSAFGTLVLLTPQLQSSINSMHNMSYSLTFTAQREVLHGNTALNSTTMQSRYHL
jgi:hypothetical protein